MCIRILESSSGTETETATESISEENGANDRRPAQKSKSSKISGDFLIVFTFLHVVLELSSHSRELYSCFCKTTFNSLINFVY